MMIGLILTVLAGPGLPSQAAPRQESVIPRITAEWMSEDDGVLELKLAHEEKARPDGGVLRVDSRRRLVEWHGIPGEVGCKMKVEVSFDDVKGVSVSDQAGFVLELRTGKNKKLTFLPVPHAWWFVQQWTAEGGNLGHNLPEGTLRTQDGEMGAAGASAGAAPRPKHRDTPPQVAADTRTAANAVLAALGRDLLR